MRRAVGAIVLLLCAIAVGEHWTDDRRTTYMAYDLGATPVKHQVYVWGAPGEYHYVPIRDAPR